MTIPGIERASVPRLLVVAAVLVVSLPALRGRGDESAPAPVPALPPDVPPLDGASVDARLSDARATILSVQTASRGAGGIRQAWIAAAEHAGMHVTAAHEESGSASLQDAAGHRSYMIVRDWGTGYAMAIYGRGGDSRPVLPGACVPVPQVQFTISVSSGGVRDDGEYISSDMTWRAGTFYSEDADADGELDALVPEPAPANTCPWDLRHALYVLRGTCGHRLGVLGPGPPADGNRHLAPDRSGFRRLRFESESAHQEHGPIPFMQRTVTEWGFVHGLYRLRHRTTSSGICHHCATSWCVRQ